MDRAPESPVGPPRRNTAIFVDMENLFGGYRGDVTNVPIKRILEQIEERARASGVLSAVALTRAYANWSDPRLNIYRREMMEYGVEPVQVFSFGQAVKNAADIELVVDALSVALESDRIDVFVIISGDGGFVPLLRKLHALGRYTIVAATESTSAAKLLRSVADAFYIVGSEDLDDGGDLVADRVPTLAAPGAAADQPPLEKILAFVRGLLKKTPSLLTENGAVVNSASVGLALHQEFPTFEASNYPGRSVTKLVENALGHPVRSSQTPIATTDPRAPSANEAPSAIPKAELRHITGVAPTSRSQYRATLHEVFGSDAFREMIGARMEGGGVPLATLASSLPLMAPNLPDVGVLFPTFKLGIRYALTGSKYVLIGHEKNYFVVERSAADDLGAAVVSDLDEDDLGTEEIVRKVLMKGRLSLRFPERSAIAAAIHFAVSAAMEARSFVDLLDAMSEDNPEHPAEALKSAIFLLMKTGVLTWSDEPSLTQRTLRLATGISTAPDAIARIHDVAKAELEAVSWQPHETVLEHLLPL